MHYYYISISEKSTFITSGIVAQFKGTEEGFVLNNFKCQAVVGSYL